MNLWLIHISRKAESIYPYATVCTSPLLVDVGVGSMIILTFYTMKPSVGRHHIIFFHPINSYQRQTRQGNDRHSAHMA